MKKQLLFFTLNLCSFFAFAQLDFYQQPLMSYDYAVGEKAISLYTDVDGDGDLDIISGALSGTKIGWQENLDGSGTFGNFKLITENVNQVSALHDIDIDGDGDIDLISGSTDDGKIAWYENDGQGNFGPQNILIQYLDDVSAVYGSDVDGDGDIDIVASVDCCTITWFENTDEQGTFIAQNDITNVANPTSIFLEDMDGDGDMDIVTNASLLNAYVRILWLENLNGQGNFDSPQILYTFSLETYSPYYISQVKSQVHASDIDNDGDKDIVFTAMREMGYIKNTDGLGNFTEESTNIIYQADPNSGTKFVQVFSVDMDADGDLDIVTNSIETGNSAKVAWYENSDGQGDFSSQITMTNWSDGNNFIDVGDVDLDGDLDVLSDSNAPYDYNAAWFKNDGTNLVFEGPEYISSFFYTPSSATAIDLDSDGDLDIVNLVSDYLVWYENLDGQGNFSNQQVLAATVGGRLQFLDFNGDGYIDILASNSDGPMWLQNDGSENFTNQIQIPSNTNSSNIFPGDIDGDGDMDLVSTNYVNTSSNYIAYNENLDGLGNFGESQTIINLGSNHISELQIKDFDGDNDNDIAFVGHDGAGNASGGGQIGWIKNLDGTGNFGAKITLYDGEANSIDAADMDGDGDIDIVTGTHSPSILAWFENTDGLGNFSSREIILITNQLNGITDVKATDLDTDGDLDIVIGSRYENNIEWFENVNGTADSFTKKTITTGIDGVNSVWPGDINGDGVLDIVFSASDGGYPVGWFRNSGLLTNRLNGQIILDVDDNGCGGILDPKLENLRVETTNGTETISTFTDNYGYYQIFPTQEGTYTTTIETDITYYNSTPDYVESTFTGFGNIETADFCFTANQAVNDLKIDIITLNDARPGFQSRYAIRYQNIGTVMQSGTVVVDFDGSKLDFLGAGQTGITHTENQFSFNFSNLRPFEDRRVRPIFQVLPPPTVNIGDVLSFTATINPISGDVTEPNNITQLDQVVIGSYDPNDITVKEGPQIQIEDVDEFLHYVIRFQNTGTASAINVQVENTLDPDLDWSTIEMEYISHNNFIEIMNGNKVKFIFEDINLPDSSSSETGSQGYIAYKIKPKNTSLVGDIFYNSAEIYFDYNLPIYTNIVETEVVDNNLSIDDFRREESYIYPNPTNGIINITSNKTIKTIEIYNNLGQLVVSKTNENIIDISYLENGLYFIKFSDLSNNTFIKKVIKKN